MARTESSERVQVRAEAKWVRMSARKARIVLDNIRGRTVPEARTVLAFTPRAAAREIDRVLRSAVANAESGHALDGDDLVITAAYADEGPTLKRWRARARGRVNRIRKRTCHITVVVAPAEQRRLEKRAPKQVDDTVGSSAPVEGTSSAQPKAARKRAAKKEVAA
jgi:large subunit ribosomal protein L22